MAKPLVFLFGDQEYPLYLYKVDRTKLYGSKEIEVVDEQEELCELATLADDGRTLIGKGGTGLGWLDADGKWCDKAQLKPHNVDGDLIEPVASTFNAPIKLFDTASEGEFLQHNIRLVYLLKFEGPSDSTSSASDMTQLMQELQRGTIFQFAYSFRGGLEADVAFLLLNEDNELMMTVGNPTQISMVGMQSRVLAQETDPEKDASDLMSFDMI